MGLVGHDQAPVAGQRPRRLEVAGDLGRVVGVGVVDPHSPGLALALHPPAGAGESPEPGAQVVEAAGRAAARAASAAERRRGRSGGRAPGGSPGRGARSPRLTSNDERRPARLEAGRRGRRASGSSPTVATSGRAPAPARRARRRRGRRRTARGSRRVDRADELGERRVVGLLGPPHVEVVGVDVGDQRGVGVGRRGRRRRSRRPRRRRGRRCRRRRCDRWRRARPPIAYVGSAPAARGRPSSAARWWWSCRGCRRPRRTRRPAITDFSPAERGRIRSPRAAALEHLGVVVAGGGGDHERCRRRRRGSAS